MDSSLQILELSRIIKNFGNKNSKSLFQSNQKKSQIRALARKFAFQSGENEHDWALEICRTSEHDQKYIRIRSQLKRLLISRVFHLDIRSGSELRKAIYRNAKELFCIRVLIMLGARGAAVALIPRALDRARTFELTNDRIELLHILRQHATINGYRKKFAEYQKELDDVERIRCAERRLNALDDAINVELVGRARAPKAAIELAKSARAEAEMLFREFPRFNVGVHYYRIATLAAETSRQFTELIRLCSEAEYFLAQFPHLVTPLFAGQYAIKRLTPSIALSNESSTVSALEICERSFPVGENNWFIWKECEFFFRMHTGDFESAQRVFASIAGNDRFQSQPEQVRQKWALLGYYADFARSAKSPSAPVRLRAFHHILRETPIYKKDKAGYNASLYILQYLIAASRSDHETLLQRSEAIAKYTSRYLRNRHEQQLYAFLKTLQVLRKHDFNVDETAIRARRYIKQFSVRGKELIDETQVLPYPMMWLWISEWLRKSY